MLTTTKERPIIFTGESVRAILAGRKTQTRRVVKSQPADLTTHPVMLTDGVRFATERHWSKSPYGVAGDRLWVRETFRETWSSTQYPENAPPVCRAGVEYRATWNGSRDSGARTITVKEPRYGGDSATDGGIKWRSPLHMPRWASRITLEVTGVRVERLQGIAECDCEAELGFCRGELGDNAYPEFRKHWDSINGKKHPWSSNPWVWVVEFKRVTEGN